MCLAARVSGFRWAMAGSLKCTHKPRIGTIMRIPKLLINYLRTPPKKTNKKKKTTTTTTNNPPYKGNIGTLICGCFGEGGS